MLLRQINDEEELRDGRTYLCCRRSRQGNAIWETLEAQKHFLLRDGVKMRFTMYNKVYDLPRTMADMDTA